MGLWEKIKTWFIYGTTEPSVPPNTPSGQDAKSNSKKGGESTETFYTDRPLKETRKNETKPTEKSKPFIGVFVQPIINDSKAPTLAIDLGTCNSSVGIIYRDRPFVMEHENGKESEPSVVTFTQNGLIFVGNDAVKSREKYEGASVTIGAIKRRMGEASGTVIVNGKKIYPQIIAALIIAHLKKKAETYFGISFNDVVITTPANFNMVQRKSIKEAAGLAGLRVIRVLNEAVAAAVGHGSPYGGYANIVVVDVGGGTFDCSVVNVGEGIFEVKAVDGDKKLGGEDFTNKILEYLLSYIKNEMFLSVESNSVTMLRLREAAENAKIALSSQENFEINIPYVQTKANELVNIETYITREQYERLIEEYVDRIIHLINDVLGAAGCSASEIDRIVLVGGTTKTPLIRNKIIEIFGSRKISPLRYAKPESAVIIGTIVMGAVLSGNTGSEDIVVLDVLPRGIGIGLQDGKCGILIGKNTTIPTKKSKVFTTSEDNQKSVCLPFYLGDSEKVEENEYICSLSLDGLPKAKKGNPQIKVTVDVDADGTIHFSGEDQETGKSVKTKVDMANSLTGEEKEKIGKAIKDWLYFEKNFSI